MLLLSEKIDCGFYDSNDRFPRKSRSPLRRLKEFELELYSEERGTRVIDGVSYPIRRRMLLCCKPGMQSYSLLPFRCRFIHFTTESAAIAKMLFRFPVCTELSENDYLRLLLQFSALTRCLAGEEDAAWREIRAGSILYGIFADCRELLLPEQSEPVHPAVKQAVEYMENHMDYPCDIAELAALVHLSPNYFRTLFCREIGASPRRFLENLRVERAKKLLLTENQPLAELALELGFSSQSHFGEVFRTAVGMTPARYRRLRSKKY